MRPSSPHEFAPPLPGGGAAPGPAMPEVQVLRMQYRMMINYNYLVVDPASRQAVVVDPAWEIDKIDRALEEAGAELAGVLVTHSHPDHLNLAGPVAEQRRCPIWMSRREVDDCGFRHAWLQPIEAAPWYVGGLQIQPLPTPGHTPGCVCFLVGDSLFTGDVLFAEGCGMCPDAAAAVQMFESLAYLKALLAPEVRIYPGHSYGKPPGQTFGSLRRNNIYLQFKDPALFTAFRMRPSQSRASVFGE